MIEYIKGNLTDLTPTYAVIEAAGVGYAINIALPSYSAMVGKENTETKLFVTEIIREKILLHYDKEIPYVCEAAVEHFKETDGSIYIKALIFVERDSQKGIIIGHEGAALKRVATDARRELEKFFGKKIFLEIYVKVDKDWRNSDKQLRRFGYDQKD